MKRWIFPIVLLLNYAAMGQQYDIRGQLADSVGSPLPHASVLLLNTADSSLISFTISNGGGVFELKNLRRTTYLLKITFMGYAPLIHSVYPPADEKLLDLGVIRMKPGSLELEGVIVEGAQLPMKINKDTIEFNADFFKTRKNASVEELLEKIPGVEVDEDGTIRAHGQEIKGIMVNGKEFFGSDPKIASRNLPAEAVDQVQVFDKKSDKATFTGIDDGQQEKTINLELKEGYRNSTFGKLTAGGGTDERFQANTSINHFKPGQQLSFLGMGNNTNEQGFSIGDYLNFTGGPQQRSGGRGPRFVARPAGEAKASGELPLNTGQSANGLMTNWAGGVNFYEAFSDKLELRGDYFLSYLDHTTDQSLERNSFLPEGNYDFLQNSRQQNNHTSHRANAIVDFRPDSANTLKLTTSFNYNKTEMDAESQSSTLAPEGTGGSSSRQSNVNLGNAMDFNAGLLYRHRFGKPGRTISANLMLDAGENQREGKLDASTEFPDSQLPAAHIRQEHSQVTDKQHYGAGLSYTEPLGGNKYLEANYEFREQLNDVNRDVWDLVDETSVYNEQLSSNYNSSYRYQRGGLNFRLAGGTYNLTAGLSLQQSRLNGELLLRDTSITRNYQSFLPSLEFRYDFPGNKHLEFSYRTLLTEPTIEQLQPVTDNSDPLNLYRGNPELQPAYMHRARLNYITFNPSSRTHFFGFLDVSYADDAISYTQTVDEQFVRTTQPMNVGEQLQIRGNAVFGFPLSGINSRLDLSAHLSREQGMSLLNGAENKTRQDEISGGLRYNYNYGELFDLRLSGNISSERNIYDTGEDQVFFNQRYKAESTLSFLKNFNLGLSFNYFLYNSQADNFSQDIPLLDLSISRYLLKNKSGEIKLSVDNLLNNDLGVVQQAGANYMERSVTQSLGRYFILSFTYTLNKQLDPSNGRKGSKIRIGG